MTDDVKLIVNTLRECAVDTQCSKCVVICNDECLFTAAAKRIEFLSAKLEHVKRVAAEDMKKVADECPNSVACTVCSHEEEPCLSCEFKWRGV